MDIPSLFMIPSAVSSGKVHSVFPNSTDADFNFARSSTASRVNSDGLIETVASGQARLNYEIEGGLVNTKPSLLLEPQSTNLFSHSESFSESSWEKNNIDFLKLTSDIAPDGTNNSVYNFKGDNSNLFTNTQSANVEYTISFYVKSNGNGKDNFKLRLGGGFSEFTATNEWVRYTYKATPTSQVFGISSNGIDSDVLIFGAQLEQLSHATSYIPTNGSTQTRAAETCNGAGTSSILPSEEGILYCEIEIPNISTTNSYPIAIFGTGATIQIYYRSASQSISFLSSVGGIQYLFHSTVNPLGKHKLALAYKQGRYSAYIDGSLVNRQSSGNVPSNGTLNTLSLADNGSSSFFGKVQDVRVYNTKEMTDSEVDILLTKITS